MFGGFPTAGPMTMRGSMPSFLQAQQSPQWGQPFSTANAQAMFPQFMAQLAQQPNLGATAPNWQQYWPTSQGGPTGGLNPDGTLPTADPAQQAPPGTPVTPTQEELADMLAKMLEMPGGAGSGGGGM